MRIGCRAIGFRSVLRSALLLGTATPLCCLNYLFGLIVACAFWFSDRFASFPFVSLLDYIIIVAVDEPHL